MNKDNIPVNDILARLKISALNEMQLSFLETASPHRDVILLSATGSGKTIAFLLSVLQQLDTATGQTQALIITPSRELAQQIEIVFKKMGTGFKVTSCYGGHLRETEENNLKEAPALIIGGAIRGLVDWQQKRKGEYIAPEEEDLGKGNLFATGLVAGGAIAGVIVAFLSVNGTIAKALTKVNLEEALSSMLGGALGYEILGVLFFAALGLLLYRVARSEK